MGDRKDRSAGLTINCTLLAASETAVQCCRYIYIDGVDEPVCWPMDSPLTSASAEWVAINDYTAINSSSCRSRLTYRAIPGHKRRHCRWKLSQELKGKIHMLHSLQSIRAWKWPVVKDKHIKIKRRICLLFVFDLDSECKFINNKIMVIKEKNMLLAAALRGWMDGRRFCWQK